MCDDCKGGPDAGKAMPDLTVGAVLAAKEREALEQMRREHSHHTFGFRCAGCDALRKIDANQS